MSYADVDLYGFTIQGDNIISFTSYLSERMKKILLQKRNQFSIKEGETVLQEINRVITLYPYFPFGYWAKFNYLHRAKDAQWKGGTFFNPLTGE